MSSLTSGVTAGENVVVTGQLTRAVPGGKVRIVPTPGGRPDAACGAQAPRKEANHEFFRTVCPPPGHDGGADRLGRSCLAFWPICTLPVNDLPAVDYPVIQVHVNYPGATPDTMANNVATPLERQFMQIPGLEMVT